MAGTDRFAVANAVSRQAHPQGAGTVFIASGSNFPDALSAGPAAAHRGAPLLLTTTGSLPASVRDEIERLAPSTIVIVGGPASVSSAVEGTLRTLTRTVTRIGGADRYAVSRNVASYAFGSGSPVAYLATGRNYPDALSAGSAAGSTPGPVILVDGAAATPGAETTALIDQLGVTTVKVAGGPASVSAALVSSVDRSVDRVVRLSGDDRFSASVAINADGYRASSTAYIATGHNYPDALVGSVLASKNKAALYLVQSRCIPEQVLEEFAAMKTTRVVLFGGEASLATSVAQLVSCDNVAAAPPAAPQPAAPVVTQPVVTPPVVTQPVVTPPVTAPPVVTPPVVTQPVVTPPVVTPPVVTPPVSTPPVSTPPRTGTPSASNTGLLPGTKLTVHNGNLKITTPGTVIDGMDIRGKVSVDAPNVTIKNSIVRGPAGGFTGSSGLITATSGQPGLVITDVELAPTVQNGYANGIIGHNFTATRLNIHHVIDGVHITGSNTTVEASWIHDLLHYDRDPNQGGTPSHDDAIQVQVGDRIRIVGNHLSSAKNAALMVTQDRGTVSNLEFSRNFADGGACTVNISEKGKGAIRGTVMRDNVFGTNTRNPNCPIISPVTTVIQVSNNVFTTGAVASVRRG